MTVVDDCLSAGIVPQESAEAALFCANPAHRLRVADAGRPAGTDAELEARIENAAGMPVSDYLSQYGPRLVPTADALKSRYEGSGSYQIDGVHLRFEGLDDARYLADDALLVLEFVDRTEVYRRA